MAAYFETRLSPENSVSSYVDIQWHNSYPIAAIASSSEEDSKGEVTFFTDEGDKVGNVNLSAELNITCTQWHPQRKILAIGCDNGEIYVWNDYEKELIPASGSHLAAIAIMRWSSSATRIASADSQGTVIGWKVDSKGQLETLFRHDLKDPITDMLFPTHSSRHNLMRDMGGLARAAVSGDQQALDLFSSWKVDKGSAASTSGLNYLSKETKENLSIYVSSQTGALYNITEKSFVELMRTDVGIRQLLHHERKDLLVIVNETPVIVQCKIKDDGNMEEISRVKLSGRNRDVVVAWAGIGIIAMTTGESSIRMWNLDSGENYALSLEGNHFNVGAEVVTCLGYSPHKGVLAAGTNLGNLALWRYSAVGSKDIKENSEKLWKSQTPCAVQGAVKRLQWGSVKHNLAVVTTKNAYILIEHFLVSHYNDQVAAVQTSPSCLSIDLFQTKKNINVTCEIQIKGAYVTKDYVAVWDGKKVAVYDISGDANRGYKAGSFLCETYSIAMKEQNVYTITSGSIQIRTFQGTVKQSLSFMVENDGEADKFDICNAYLVAATNKGRVRIWDVSLREAKPRTNTKSLADCVPNVASLDSVKVNYSATKVSFFISKFASVLYIWDIESDSILKFDLITVNKSDKKPDHSTSSMNMALELENGRFVSHFWDQEEARLLVCEVIARDVVSEKIPKTEKVTSAALSFFVTSEHGVLIQDCFYLDGSNQRLLGLKIPYYYFLVKRDDVDNSAESAKSLTCAVPLRDFVGLDEQDKQLRDAMMNFSFYLSIGNMDEAFKAIKRVKSSSSIWENMARMCVKTKRLDVAIVCLGHMGHAVGARALRQCSNEPELDVRVAMLAIHLNMLNEAEQLYEDCGRFDLLNKFYQASCQWEKALQIAIDHDRINLRKTYYNYAKFLEAKNETADAIAYYEKCNTHRFEVPRMLFDDPMVLEKYILAKDDKALNRWWAQYMESTGEMETALQFYEKAEDFLSLVRVYCYCNNLDKASEIANETTDRAACFHLARQYENNGNVKQALHFFMRAHAFTNGIRICKENGLEDQLLNLALMGGPAQMVEAARYYEVKPGQTDKAVMLYHKGGFVGKAVDLAFKTKQFSALTQLASDLDETTDPQLLQRCAQFLVENKQFEKAVDLFAKAKKYQEAIELCSQNHVTITDSLAEKLTPAKTTNDNSARSKILEALAKCCFEQQSYHLATKKFTQAGNKVQAMKALLKSGDTEKIVFFAGVSRQREIYIMAANYLQTLNWRKDHDIMKNIISFYTKGKALDLLAAFYDSCAQVEIDEYQNYEKAIGALNEAYKCAEKLQSTNGGNQYGEKTKQLQIKLDLVKRFIQARRAYEDNPEEAMRQCQSLLGEHNLEIGVRRGDVLGFMIEHYAAQQNYKMAYNLIEEMHSKMPNANVAFYVKAKTIEDIHQALDIPLKQGESHGNNWEILKNDGEVGEEVVEEVNDI